MLFFWMNGAPWKLNLWCPNISLIIKKGCHLSMQHMHFPANTWLLLIFFFFNISTYSGMLIQYTSYIYIETHVSAYAHTLQLLNPISTRPWNLIFCFLTCLRLLPFLVYRDFIFSIDVLRHSKTCKWFSYSPFSHIFLTW